MITIIDYGVGNIGSLNNTLDSLGFRTEITSDPRSIQDARFLILPGVGAAGYGMQQLRERALDTALRKAVAIGTPLIGICLGMQLLFDASEENDTTCLGIIPGRVKKFGIGCKVPQIGWNRVSPEVRNPNAASLFSGISQTASFYFVHSYYPVPDDVSMVAGYTEYGVRFPSIIRTGALLATQFHPEKSGNAGLTLLTNFIKEYV